MTQNPLNEHAAGLAELEAELGADVPKFRWGNADIPILPGTAHLGKNLEVGGFALTSDLSFSVRVAAFGQNRDAATLKSNLLETHMTYLGQPFKITNVHIAPGAQQMRIDANADAQAVVNR